MQKTVLLIHGWPKPIGKDDNIYRYFRQNGFRVCCPYLIRNETKFSVGGIRKILAKSLAGRTPDVIVGISLGGLLAPMIATDYPNSRLVIVASGVCYSPDNWVAKYGPKLCRAGLREVIRSFDRKLLLRAYKLINPNKSKKGERDQDDREIFNNMNRVLGLPDRRIREVIDFVYRVDNRELLPKIENKTIIFSGSHDTIMPCSQGRLMNHLVKNSQLFILGGRHHDLIGSGMLKILGDFLEF